MKNKLHWQILIALASAVLLGIFIQNGAPETLSHALLTLCKFLGQMFFNALKMLVVPLIVPSIICGMMGLGKDNNFGRIGLKTLSYYMVSGLLAILTGLIFVNAIQPGKVDAETSAAMMSQAQDPSIFMSKVEGRGASDFAEIFIRMIPPNVLDAATNNGQLLGVIFFSLLFGFFITQLPDSLRETQEKMWRSGLEVMMKIADLIIRFAPIGVFALVTPIVSETGLGAFVPLLKFFLTVMGALGFHFLVTLPLILKLFKVSPSKHYKAVSPALLTAFSTASSASTLPVTLESVEQRAGISNRVSSFTLPLGATVNMDGTALYECVVVMFIAQINGIDLSLTTQFTVVLMALLTSIGVAGIPSASLVAIAVILGAVGLPIESVGIIMVTDRFLDMCRTSVNVFSDTCAAAIIASSEGEELYQNGDPA